MIELMIVTAIIAVIAAIAIPGLLSAQRSANERNASTSLRSIATAEIDFRSNDRDGNRVCDFWTAGLAGLMLLQVSSDGQAWSVPIKLIDPSVAAADVETTGNIEAQAATDGANWWYRVTPNAMPPRGAKAGYWYYPLVSDMSTGSGESYQVATDGAANAAYKHLTMFGFGTFPDSFGLGRSLFIINESATILRWRLPSDYLRPGAGSYPPGAIAAGTTVSTRDGLIITNYPQDSELSKFSRMD